MARQGVEGGLSTRGACYAEQQHATGDTHLFETDLAIPRHTEYLLMYIEPLRSQQSRTEA